MLEVIPNPSGKDLDAVRALFREHGLTVHHHVGTESILADAIALPGHYAPPRGALYLARLDGVPAGCAALHGLDLTIGEVKRVFVRQSARRRGVARALMERLLADAARLGYTKLRLGTLDEMAAAHALYRDLGFVPIPSYRKDEVDTMFFERDLSRESTD